MPLKPISEGPISFQVQFGNWILIGVRPVCLIFFKKKSNWPWKVEEIEFFSLRKTHESFQSFCNPTCKLVSIY